MRCKACDVALSDRESTRKAEGTGEYLDLCDKCVGPIVYVGIVDSPVNADEESFNGVEEVVEDDDVFLTQEDFHQGE
jgi:hypothetical protein